MTSISVLDGLAALSGVTGVRRAHPPSPGENGLARARRSVPQVDRIELSPEARSAKAREDADGPSSRGATRPDHELTDEEHYQVDELRRRDSAVREHEQAHKAAAGPYAGPISYSYTTGPDGRRYAVTGEVPIDVSPVEGDPEATIRKMQAVRRAALAPSEPSAADRSVAARAQRQEQQALAKLSERAGEGLEAASNQQPRDSHGGPAADPLAGRADGHLIDLLA